MLRRLGLGLEEACWYYLGAAAVDSRALSALVGGAAVEVAGLAGSQNMCACQGYS